MTDTKKAVQKAEEAVPDSVKIEEKELDHDIKIALEQQARLAEDRKASPEVSIGNRYEDAMDALSKRYVPESVPDKAPRGTLRKENEFMKGATKRTFWGHNNPARHSACLNQGWMPVVRTIGGKRVQVTSPNGDMLLYERPIVHTLDALNQSIAYGKARDDGKKKMNVPEEGLYEDELTITRENVN